MRKSIILLLLCLSAALFATACGKKDEENGNVTGTPKPTSAPTLTTTPAPTTPSPGNEAADGEPIDMEVFLKEIAKSNPGADPDAIVAEILKSPYFALFAVQKIHYDWGSQYLGMKDDSAFLGKGKDACICNDAGGTGALVYVFAPQKPEDAQGIADALRANADPEWMGNEEEGILDGQVCLVIDGKVYFAMYETGMKPVTGTVAEKARDLVGIFHECLAKDPKASCLSIAEYMVGHQKFNGVYAGTVKEGTLTGFGDMENEVTITGFAEGAAVKPMLSPNLFICYVFRVGDGKSTAEFVEMLRDKANLNWNVCMTADTIITETDGNTVLFIMCSEKEG